MEDNSLEIVVFDRGACRFRTPITGRTVAIGRQRKGEPAPYTAIDPGTVGDRAVPMRVIIAKLTDETISRSQVLIEIDDDRRQMVVRNTSRNVEISVPGQIVGPGRQVRIDVGSSVQVGEWRITVRSPREPAGSSLYETLTHNTVVPGTRARSGLLRDLFESRVKQKELDVFSPVLDAAVEVLQCAAGGPDFEKQAVLTLLEQSDFQRAAVLKLDRDSRDWRVVSQAPEQPARPWQPSRRVLQLILQERRPIRNRPVESTGASLASVATLIATPIFASDGEVEGVLYADRTEGVNDREISDFEQLLSRILASGIASGWERMSAQHRAVSARTLFEQFFTPELARSLDQDPNLLSGRQQEISVLFCDIRGFSRISEQIGPAVTMEWIESVMTGLAESVLANDGVLVDFIGDELMAMWGAPLPKSDHATAASRAAIDMTNRLGDLNRQWESRLPCRFDLGIGIHSGEAFVGNTGSQQKFKYGPLGHTVNLASRIQGATKFFGTRVLVTGATETQLPESLPRRRLTQARVVGIDNPVTLYELRSGHGAHNLAWCRQYEEALDLFEQGHLADAVNQLGDVLGEVPSDKPSLLLMRRLTEALFDREENPSPVWPLPSK